MSKKIMKIGLVQMKCGKRPNDNVAQALQRIKKLAKLGAEIVCLPELFRTQYFCQTKDNRFFALAEDLSQSPAVKALRECAKNSNVAIVASLYEKTSQKKYYNTALVINKQGSVISKYRKMHIPADLKNHYGESYYFEKGNLGFQSFTVNDVKMGVLVCWDQWFPEAARMVAQRGAKIIFYSTAIGFQVKDRYGVNAAEYEAWQTIQKSHSIANNVFVATANRTGTEKYLRFWGTSFVSNPYGHIIAKAPMHQECDLLVDCDLSLVRQMRRDWPFLQNRRVKYAQ